MEENNKPQTEETTQEPTGKPYLTEGSKSWVEWLIKYRGHDYADKYTPDIYKPNAFSSSTLTYSVQKQVDMKLGKAEFVPTEKMTAGEAIHQWIQGKLSSGYACDPEIRMTIPFEWKSIPEKEIIIIGHPDAVNLFDQNLLEYKTSFGKSATGKIQDYQVRQAAFYWLAIKRKLGIDCDVRVVKIWSDGDEGGVTEWTLQPDEKEKYSQQMIDNALIAAGILDEIYLKEGLPQLGQAK